jgi:hypothetical protein
VATATVTPINSEMIANKAMDLRTGLFTDFRISALILSFDIHRKGQRKLSKAVQFALPLSDPH